MEVLQSYLRLAWRPTLRSSAATRSSSVRGRPLPANALTPWSCNAASSGATRSGSPHSPRHLAYGSPSSSRLRHCISSTASYSPKTKVDVIGVKAERFAERLWPLAYHYLSRGGKYVDTERARRDGGTHPRSLLSFISCSFLCLKVGRVPIQSLVRGRALTVFQVGALSHFDNVTVWIADVAANLAVLGYRLCDELRSATCP
jgi:hypothetical protein